MHTRAALVVAAGSALFLGSALLFNVQPMTGRLLLPHFGGSAAVWTACLVAFQVLLLAGYAYAAWLTRLTVRVQFLVHLLLLGGALAWPGLTCLDPGTVDGLPPVLAVLLLVLAGTGPAYLLLSAGSTLLQSWLAKGRPEWNIYRLYAVSNAGSLIGLFAYPFLLEPHLSLPAQQVLWRVLYGVYAVVLACVAAGVRRASAGPAGREAANVPPKASPAGAAYDPARTRSWWLLPLLASFLLTAATASLTQDMTPIPMVWCLLLGAFLLSYVIGFTRVGERHVPLWALLGACLMAGYGVIRWQGWGGLPLLLFFGVGIVLFGGLFLCGRLYSERPPAERLPAYYLAIASGGAVGGLLAGVAAPLLLKGVYEYSLIAVVMAMGIVFYTVRRRRERDFVEVGVAVLAALVVGMLEPLIYAGQVTHSIWRARNFYGVLHVTDSEIDSRYGDRLGRLHSLVHGATVHGFQARTPALRDEPTQYYGRLAGGYAIQRQVSLHPDRRLRVGVIGLGAGTLAVYGRQGDDYRFYEINPQVVDAARDPELFSFLGDSAARIDVAMGDARLSLENERKRGEPPWDVLVVDAFTGDSVPLHLLTREAVGLFLDRVGAEGVAAFHISNRSIDLLPLLKAAARERGVRFFAWHNRAGKNPMESDSRWVLMTRAEGAFETRGSMLPIPEDAIPDYPVMTDQFGGILPLVDWSGERLAGYLQKR